MGIPTSTVPRDTTHVNTDDQEVYSPNFHSDTPAELLLWNQSLPSLLKFMYAFMWKYKPLSTKESFYCPFSKVFMLRDWRDGSAGKEPAAQRSGPEFASLAPIWRRMLLRTSAIPALAPKRRWKVETARPRQLQVRSKDTVHNKVGGEDWHLRLSFTQIASLYAHPQMYIYTNIHKFKK